MKRALLALTVFVSGCCADPTKDEVHQERAFFNVVDPRFRAYSESDATLSPAKKQDDKDFLDAYNSWLKNREGLAK